MYVCVKMKFNIHLYITHIIHAIFKMHSGCYTPDASKGPCWNAHDLSSWSCRVLRRPVDDSFPFRSFSKAGGKSWTNIIKHHRKMDKHALKMRCFPMTLPLFGRPLDPPVGQALGHGTWRWPPETHGPRAECLMATHSPGTAALRHPPGWSPRRRGCPVKTWQLLLFDTRKTFCSKRLRVTGD